MPGSTNPPAASSPVTARWPISCVVTVRTICSPATAVSATGVSTPVFVIVISTGPDDVVVVLCAVDGVGGAGAAWLSDPLGPHAMYRPSASAAHAVPSATRHATSMAKKYA